MQSNLWRRERGAAKTRHAEHYSMPVVLLLPAIAVDTQIVPFFERKQLVGNVHAGNVDGCEVQPNIDRDHKAVASLPALQQLTDLVVAYAICVIRRVALLVQHEGAEAVDEAAFVIVVYIDDCLRSFEASRGESRPSCTLDAKG